MYYLSVTRWFSAAHWLPNFPGKCKDLHGHNWKVIATLRAKKLDEKSDMVLDFSIFKGLVDEILPDHKCINEEIPDIYPTAENLAKWIFEQLDESLSKNAVYAEMWDVEIWEGRDSCVNYTSQ